MNWDVGSRLELNCSPASKVGLRSGEVTMALGHMGRSGGNIAVQITDKLVREGEIP